MKKKFEGGKGFSLVELLIVIVVIGILSAMMMLSSTEAVSSAKAAKVVSDMRNLKLATMEWFLDNLGSNLTFYQDGENSYAINYRDLNKPRSIHNIFKNKKEYRFDITKYLGAKDTIINNNGNDPCTDDDGFAIIDASAIHEGKSNTYKDFQRWYVAYQTPKNDSKLQAKLAQHAKSAGLLKNYKDMYDGTTNHVYMEIIDFTED